MTPLLLLLMAAKPTAPTEVSVLRDRFLAGDLVTLTRGLGLIEDRGEGPLAGRLGLLEDLSRLVRCLPLAPVPPESSPQIRAARGAVRLERVRVQQLTHDALYAGTSLGALLARPPLYETRTADPSGRFVVWPVEQERWPQEVLAREPSPSSCPRVPGGHGEKGRARDQARAARRVAQQKMVAAALMEVELLPPALSGRVALAFLEGLAEAGDATPVLEPWAGKLAVALSRASPPERSAAKMLLAVETERRDAPREALYRAVIDDPSATQAEKSRAMVRLTALIEPDWAQILALLDGFEGRPVDRPALTNAMARSLFALGKKEALMTFGRRWLVGGRSDGRFDLQTYDLLVRLGVTMAPGEAMTWIEEIAAKDQKSRTQALSTLADLAVGERQYDLAVAIYDRLRLEAAAARARRGPRAAKQQARWLRARAIVEYDRNDVGAFAGFVDDILQLAKEEEGRALARFAPHRSVALLCQTLVGRLTNDVPVDPEREQFAALLLEAVTALAAQETRHKKNLNRFVAPLTTLAGRWAEGRVPRKKPKSRSVRQLGEVVVPRLPPRLVPPDQPTPVPIIDSFLVYEDRSGRLVAGAPWTELSERRRAAKMEP